VKHSDRKLFLEGNADPAACYTSFGAPPDMAA